MELCFILEPTQQKDRWAGGVALTSQSTRMELCFILEPTQQLVCWVGIAYE